MITGPDRPLALLRHGSRSLVTCANRCGNACDRPVPNHSDNTYFGDVAVAGLSRRRLLQAGGLGLAVAATGSVLRAGPAAASSVAPTLPPAAVGAVPAAATADAVRIAFQAVPPNVLDTVTVAKRYRWDVVIGWGDAVEAGAPPFDPYDQSPEAQAKQFGYNCDFLSVLPVDDDRALLVVNHEYTSDQLMFPGWTGTPTAEQIEIAMAAVGLSVAVIERRGKGGRWVRPATPNALDRRVTARTPITLAGPVAGHPLVRTAADPTGTVVLGTLNNCAGGTTPWGTTLHGEENFDNFFDASGPVDPDRVETFARYGLQTVPGLRRGWSAVDPRFDLTLEPNEANRFGWVVELDPSDPSSAPVKHSMLGRLCHEGATVRLADDGRAVVYMGDDTRFEYLYKFVSRDAMATGGDEAARVHNLQLLDRGTLYVARFTGDSPTDEIDGSGLLPSDGEFDGTGTWLRLASHTTSYVPGMSVAEVLINTRLAADLVSPTKMDRPEDVEASPVTGRVYVACTNNRQRKVDQVDEANPRATNRHGHIIEITEKRGDAAARAFGWQIVVMAGDPADPSSYFAGFDKSKVSPISCPDNLAFDPTGNLWIATNGNALGTHDGLFAMPLAGPQRGYVRQLLTVPTGAETAGPHVTDDALSVFVSVQHPGEGEGSTFEQPASDFPDGPGNPPRPSVVVVWHQDGKPIGSR